jgi:hypothetical protein
MFGNFFPIRFCNRHHALCADTLKMGEPLWLCSLKLSLYLEPSPRSVSCIDSSALTNLSLVKSRPARLNPSTKTIAFKNSSMLNCSAEHQDGTASITWLRATLSAYVDQAVVSLQAQLRLRTACPDCADSRCAQYNSLRLRIHDFCQRLLKILKAKKV